MSASTEIRFVPWTRTGIGALPASDPADDQGRRARQVPLQVTTARGAEPETKPEKTCAISVLGPGDVLGIDAGQVLRRAPRSDDHNLEPNNLVLIEFDRPDYP